MSKKYVPTPTSREVYEIRGKWNLQLKELSRETKEIEVISSQAKSLDD